jgi:hypothetical protein
MSPPAQEMTNTVTIPDEIVVLIALVAWPLTNAGIVVLWILSIALSQTQRVVPSTTEELPRPVDTTHAVEPVRRRLTAT